MERILTFIVDVDGTVCNTPFVDGKHDYKNSVPIQERIDYVNSLYDEGHEILYWTARGTSSRIDWYDHTLKQLQAWGCKFHRFSVGKPSYDVWIDDKAINASDIPPVFGDRYDD